MIPDAVDLRACEVGILRPSYPVRQSDKPIGVRGQLRRFFAEKTRRHRLVRSRPFNLALFGFPYDLLAVEFMGIQPVRTVVLQYLVADAGEEGG